MIYKRHMSIKGRDIIIIVPPTKGAQSNIPPYGAMYVAESLMRHGYDVDILNLDVDRISDHEILNRIAAANPKYIGISSMVATTYKYIKHLSLLLKKAFPEKTQVLGGGLSSAAAVVLMNTDINIVVHGEGEKTIIELLNNLNSGMDISNISGIFYMDGNVPRYTGNRRLISDIDSIPYPAFDLVSMEKYIMDEHELIMKLTSDPKYLRKIKNKKNRRSLPLLINRGCIGSCTFCVRPYPGLRQPSMKYVFDYIEYCVKKFNLGSISFIDECFSSTKQRIADFINEFKKRNLDITFRIVGLRTDAVDRELLMGLSDIGCTVINYGFESGSQKMLNIIDKNIRVDQNVNAVRWAREAGIFVPIQLILAMPGETKETIAETVRTLKLMNLDYYHYKSTYALPFPGSALYEYALVTGAIESEDGYLEMLGEIDGTQSLHINLTDEPDRIVSTWKRKIADEMMDHFIFVKYKVRNPLLKKIYFIFESVVYHINAGDLFQTAWRKILLISYSVVRARRKKEVLQQVCVKLHKKKDIFIEPLIEGCDFSGIDRRASLKNLNKKIMSALSA